MTPSVPPALDACFLGPYGENDTLLEKLVVEFLRDHVYWRRNFPSRGSAGDLDACRVAPRLRIVCEARLRRELHQLSAALKKSVPFHSPRYLGHVVSDLLIPGLAAQILTLPYNPNNVSEDAAPVTVDLEVQVGLQLAKMLGYVHDPKRVDCAFGHLTSGGTLANYQALRLALALKAFPCRTAGGRGAGHRTARRRHRRLQSRTRARHRPARPLAGLAGRAGQWRAPALATTRAAATHRISRHRRLLRTTRHAARAQGAGADQLRIIRGARA